MNTVSSSSTFSTSASSSYGMSGLVSGLDTAGMVEQLLSGTQSKIDKQNAEKQQIIWKQEIYRGLISDINGLKNSFFSSTSATNLGSLDFFNSMSAVTSSNAFRVTATSSAAAGKTSVQVGQLATASRLQSSASASGKLQGSVDLSALERRVVFTVGSGASRKEVEVEVDLSALTGTTQEERLESLAQQLDASLSGEGVSVSLESGKLSFSGEVAVSAKSSQLGLNTLGLTAGKKSQDGTLTATADLNAAISFDLDLNGITRTIRLEGLTGSSDYNDIKDAVQSQVDEAFGKGWISVDIDSQGAFSLTTKGQGNVATIGGGSTGLNLLGLREGESNKISRSQMLKDINFAQPLQGGVYQFSINGVDFSFSGEDTLSGVIKEINGSKAGVRITYSDIEDKFTIESSNTGAGYDITMSQTAGNLLNAMFGNVKFNKNGVETILDTGNTLYSGSLALDNLAGDSGFGGGASSFEYGYFKLNVNGEAVSLYIPKRSDDNGGAYSRQELMDLVNEGLASRFGFVDGGAAGTADDRQAIELIQNPDGSYAMDVRNGAQVSFADEVVYAKDGTIDQEATNKKAGGAGGLFQLAFGFSGQNNVVKDATVTLGDLNLKDLSLDGSYHGLTAGSTLQDLMTAVENDASLRSAGVTSVRITFQDGRLVVDAAGEGELTFPPFLAALFGTSSASVGKSQGSGESRVEAGQNAMLTVNGVDIERSSNTFTVSGLTISLTDTTGSYLNTSQMTQNAAGKWEDKDGNTYDDLVDSDGYLLDAKGSRIFAGEAAATVTTSRNTEKIFEGLKSFVDKYNELIGKLNGLVDADATYKDYPPLTSAQKKEMSEREVELWEEKAKEGLLRRDSNLESFLSSMRSILYTRPAGSSHALYDIGIESSNEWRDKGKLILDESKLKTMIESNPQALQELFTSAEGGLAAALSGAIDRAASTNSGSPGTLVEMAGVEGKATSITNTMTKRLREINSKIGELQKKYEKEKARYWKQFNAMESALQSLNTQSSWLAQQFS